jgi:hypothetical protein
MRRPCAPSARGVLWAVLLAAVSVGSGQRAAGGRRRAARRRPRGARSQCGAAPGGARRGPGGARAALTGRTSPGARGAPCALAAGTARGRVVAVGRLGVAARGRAAAAAAAAARGAAALRAAGVCASAHPACSGPPALDGTLAPRAAPCSALCATSPRAPARERRRPPAPPARASPPQDKPHPRGYAALRAPAPPSIDGALDEAAWRAAPWSAPFLDIVGPSGPAAFAPARVKMLWDDAALYVAARMEDRALFANETLHDAIVYRDTDFEVGAAAAGRRRGGGAGGGPLCEGAGAAEAGHARCGAGGRAGGPAGAVRGRPAHGGDACPSRPSPPPLHLGRRPGVYRP